MLKHSVPMHPHVQKTNNIFYIHKRLFSLQLKINGIDHIACFRQESQLVQTHASSIRNRVNSMHISWESGLVFSSYWTPVLSLQYWRILFFQPRNCSVSCWNLEHEAQPLIDQSYRQLHLQTYSFMCCPAFENLPFGLKPNDSSLKTLLYHHHHPSPTWAY